MGYDATTDLTSVTKLAPGPKNALTAYQHANMSLNQSINHAAVRDTASDSGMLGVGTKGYILYLHGNPLWEGSNAEYDLIYTVLLQINWRTGAVAAQELAYDGGAPASFIKALPPKLSLPDGEQKWGHLPELIEREKEQAQNTRDLPRLIRPGAKVRFAEPMPLTNGERVEWFDVTTIPSPTGRAMTTLTHKGAIVRLRRGWRAQVCAVIPAGATKPVTARVR